MIRACPGFFLLRLILTQSDDAALNIRSCFYE